MSFVEVLWTDGHIYHGTFRRSYKSQAYTVKLHKDMTLVECLRDEVYSAREAVPDLVLEKLNNR